MIGKLDTLTLQAAEALVTAAKAREAVARAVEAREAEMVRVRQLNEFVLPQMKQRDREVCVAYVEGDTLSAIGERHGLTRERIRQIILRWRVRGLTLPSERDTPLTAGGLRYVQRHVPGRGRGKSKKLTAKMANDSWVGVVGLEWGDSPKDRKRRVKHSPEHIEMLRERMRKLGLARRGNGKLQRAARENQT